ncbi:MAG: hypothetical protein ACMUHY_09240, partial [Thermoplasmatota archaeon]
MGELHLRLSILTSFPVIIILLSTTVGGFLIGDPGVVAEIPSRSGGGQLKWQVDLVPGEQVSVSTPTLADLNLDGDMEIIVLTSDGCVFALDSEGSMFWPEPFRVDDMELLGEKEWTRNDGITPPGFYSSPLVADINLGD